MEPTPPRSASSPDRPQPPRVSRPQLEARLDALPAGGVALLVAPAGSGKSVLIDQWVATQRHAAACVIAVSERCNDAAVLARAILRGLTAAGVDTGDRLGAMVPTGGESLGGTFLELLDDAVRRFDGELLVVVEDAHLLTNAALMRELGRAATSLPEKMRLVVSSRWDLPLPVSELRLRGALVELRGSDLDFDAESALALVREVSGKAVDDDLGTVLLDRTDGWAAGLQLIAISLQGAADPRSALEQAAGTDRLLVEYLTAEVLDQQSTATREFLVQTSVLPWLSAPLCDAVTFRSGAQEQLDLLWHRSVFVVPLDRSLERLRYHHLFADLLRQQFSRRPADEQHEVRLRAADWFLDQGHVVEGIEQLLAAGASQRALDTVVAHGQGFFERGESATLVAWLEQLDRSWADAPPELAINLLAAQSAANRFASARETYRAITRRLDLTRGERAAADALYACGGLDNLGVQEVIEATTSVLAGVRSLSQDEPIDFLGIGGRDSVEVISSFMMAFAQFRQGRLDNAAALLDWTSELPGMRYVVWRVNVLGLRALVHAWAGELRQADRVAHEALAEADAVGISLHVALSSAYLALGVVSLERYELDAAAAALEESGVRTRRNRGQTYAALQRVLDVRLLEVTEGVRPALELLRAPGAESPPGELPGDAAAAIEARLRLVLSDTTAAAALLAGSTASPTLAAVQVELELSRGALEAATRQLERWRPDDAQPLQVVEHAVCRAAVCAAGGDVRGAEAAVLDAVAAAELDGIRRPFLERPAVMKLIAAMARERPRSYLQTLLAAERTGASLSAGQARLVEPLTTRELSLLRFLPTRMTNQEIADALYLSVNTVKSHLRSVYRKLDVADRDAAVERAAELGLL
jgi:LuxR family maltose regulon positive regulatory protein